MLNPDITLAHSCITLMAISLGRKVEAVEVHNRLAWEILRGYWLNLSNDSNVKSLMVEHLESESSTRSVMIEYKPQLRAVERARVNPLHTSQT